MGQGGPGGQHQGGLERDDFSSSRHLELASSKLSGAGISAAFKFVLKHRPDALSVVSDFRDQT